VTTVSPFPPSSRPRVVSQDDFELEVAARFGLVPNFFRSAPDAPFVVRELWQFAKSAYLDTPIPTLFKERLFVYLSRFCEVRYCVTRHCGFLLGLGRAAGDPGAPKMTIEQVIRLLRRPVARLEAIAEPIGWPSPETSDDDDLLASATLLFLQPARAGRAKEALRTALGGEKYELLAGFLTFIRSAHYWTLMHPQLALEDDVKQLLREHGELARLLLDDSETGAAKIVHDITDRRIVEQATERLGAIVESSDDAILTKNLDGIIMSWNKSAERIFGYTSGEAIGNSVTMLIPGDMPDEEPRILARIRAGERIEHYETVRQRKDGSLVDISLTVSPLRDVSGAIVGASKIARDITEWRRAREQQDLLLREMDHRIRNLFSLASGVVNLSARTANTPQELAASVRDRLMALARAHGLTLAKPSDERPAEHPATLHALIRTIASPYEDRGQQDKPRVFVSGPDVPLSTSSVTSLALLLHEFATNAAKYGALSTPVGSIDVHCADDGDRFEFTWRERGGPRVDNTINGEGFGSLLARTAVKGQLGGTIAHDWAPEGLTIRLSVARDRLDP
jgi:PAS domain S-box-containing protein